MKKLERWKDIPGYERRYQASNQGRIRSVTHGKVLSPGRCRGYLIVNLSGYGTIAVHLLVARTFLSEPKEQVNHKDGDKHNNCLENLEWVTRGENQQHAVASGLNTQAIKVECPKTGKVYESITLAARAAHCRTETVRLFWKRI